MKNKKIIFATAILGLTSIAIWLYFSSKKKSLAKATVKNNGISDEAKLKTAILNVIERTDLSVSEKSNIILNFIQGAGLLGVVLGDESIKQLTAAAEKYDIKLKN